MNRAAFLVLALLLPSAAAAGEKVAGTNTYMLNEQQWPTGTGGFWMLNNFGTAEVTEGPLESGPVECHGSGFWDSTGVWGEGVCIYGEGANTHIWAWQAHPGRATTWTVVHGTGKYSGMTGQGKSATRTETEHRIMPVRISDWAGEVEIPD